MKMDTLMDILIIKKKKIEIEASQIQYVAYKTFCPLCEKSGRKSRLTVTTKRTCGDIEIRFMKCSCPYCFGSLFSFKVVSEKKQQAKNIP